MKKIEKEMKQESENEIIEQSESNESDENAESELE